MGKSVGDRVSSNRVSVAVCTYNGEKYVAEQLTSILNQSRPADEIVICDDASTDDTVAIVERLTRTAGPAVKIYRHEVNRGYRANFEDALRRTTGDIIFFSDQDDIWMEHKIEHVLDHFHRHRDALLVYTDGFVFDDETGERKLLSEWYGPLFRDELAAEEALIHANQTHNLKGCLMAFRAELKQFALPFGPGWGHDRWLTLIGYALSAASCVSEPLILHRRHQDTTTYRDFFGNSKPSTKKRSSLKGLLKASLHGRGKRTASSKYDYESLLERLTAAKTSPLVAADAAVLDAYISRCRHLANVAEARRSVQRSKPLVRLGSASRLLVGGYYHENFDGVYSFLDDLRGEATPARVGDSG